MFTNAQLAETVAEAGFAFVPAVKMHRLLEHYGTLSDWSAFAASWNDLGTDIFMADGGRYRKRRFAVFSAAVERVERQPHQPHYQSRDYNPLNGGIERWFEPMRPEIAASATMRGVLGFCHALFNGLSPCPSWHVEVHQFRIEARHGEPGEPTPEGMHRDGVDYVLVLLINRRNIQSGQTSIHALNGRRLGSFTLTEPCDAALVDDRRVTHGVTAVAPLDPAQGGYRDVLVVTFRAGA